MPNVMHKILITIGFEKDMNRTGYSDEKMLISHIPIRKSIQFVPTHS